jgi:hypothetical protein
MATSILHSQNFRFQITILLEGNGDFCFVNTTVSYQLYSNNNSILICFQNIFFFEKEVFEP